jgi:hypothetical protein
MNNEKKIHKIVQWMDKKEINFLYFPEDKLITANWNNVNDKIPNFIENCGYEIGYEDEYTLCCNCNRACQLYPNFYGDEPDWMIINNCEVVCKECIEDLIEDIIKEYSNNYRKAVYNWFYPYLEKNNFVCYSPDEYCKRFESGFHYGQNDNPRVISQEIEENLPEYDYIFMIDGIGQFDIQWNVFLKRRIMAL